MTVMTMLRFNLSIAIVEMVQPTGKQKMSISNFLPGFSVAKNNVTALMSKSDTGCENEDNFDTFLIPFFYYRNTSVGVSRLHLNQYLSS